MKSRKRFVWPLLALVVLVAVAGAWWGTGAHQAAPQIITLPNGDRYQFVGATYSTRNVPPVLAAQLVSWLPARVASMTRSYFGAPIAQWNQFKKFDSPQLSIWFQRLGTNSTTVGSAFGFNGRLADQSGFEAGLSSYVVFYPAGGPWCCATFPVIPKRSPVLQCNINSFAGNGKPASHVASFNFRNPAYGRFPQWQSQPVPGVKRAGELEIRLAGFATGYRDSRANFVKTNGPLRALYSEAAIVQDTETGFDISLNSPSEPSDGWVMHHAELSDATGNILRGPFKLIFYHLSQPHPPGQNVYSGFLEGTLWPNEAAWRLKLQFKHAVNFAPYELVIFKNVPVPAMGTTNTMRITNLVGGVQIVLTEFVHRPDVPTNAPGSVISSASQISVELPGKPSNVALDFLNMTTDTWKAELYESSLSDFSFVVCVKSIPANAPSVDIICVVQKTRTVEFLVKPPKAE